MKIIKPPTRLVLTASDDPVIFLAGSIEMGIAENWQSKVEKLLEKYPCTILNPRRDDWDASWVQSIDNPQFREQVEWELEGLERANLIAMYIAPNTKSPITLMEFGLYAKTGKLTICCPDGFWRKGNIDIVCERYRINQVTSIEKLVGSVVNTILPWIL